MTRYEITLHGETASKKKQPHKHQKRAFWQTIADSACRAKWSLTNTTKTMHGLKFR